MERKLPAILGPEKHGRIVKHKHIVLFHVNTHHSDHIYHPFNHHNHDEAGQGGDPCLLMTSLFKPPPPPPHYHLHYDHH